MVRLLGNQLRNNFARSCCLGYVEIIDVQAKGHVLHIFLQPLVPSSRFLPGSYFDFFLIRFFMKPIFSNLLASSVASADSSGGLSGSFSGSLSGFSSLTNLPSK